MWRLYKGMRERKIGGVRLVWTLCLWACGRGDDGLETPLVYQDGGPSRSARPVSALVPDPFAAWPTERELWAHIRVGHAGSALWVGLP
jgi:hypothetical protein